MATIINKQPVLKKLLEEASRLPEPSEPPLPVLEQFIYGLCREDATPEQADQAYRRIQKQFFDWNEIRVSSVREVEEAMSGLSNPESRAHRLINFLQEVFETTFSFDLEALAKKGLKQAAKHITRYQAADEFIGAWVAQRSLGGHSMPLDVATWRTTRRLGLLEADQDNDEEGRASLEQDVPKARGMQVTDLLSVIAENYCWDNAPQCGGCPMNTTCPTSQGSAEVGEDPSRVARLKPR